MSAGGSSGASAGANAILSCTDQLIVALAFILKGYPILRTGLIVLHFAAQP
jgi:hypothetical protein